jgi:hypothetical protein
MSDNDTLDLDNILVGLAPKDVWLELCPICTGQDTQIPPCAWCDGVGAVDHDCTCGPGWPD